MTDFELAIKTAAEKAVLMREASMTPEEELIKVKANFDRYLKDLEDAAGELLVPMPVPGTEMAKLLSANVLLKHRLQKVQEENRGLLQANRDCCAWFDALNLDHQKALQTLNELARLGNGKSYGNSTGNIIAQRCLDSLID